MPILSCLALPSFALLLAQGVPERRYEIHGQGGFLTPIGDLDQDGAPDFLAGHLRAYSGRSGAKLFAYELEPSVERDLVLLDLAANLGDVTGDGVPDLVLGAGLYSGAELLAPSTGVRPAARPGSPARGHAASEVQPFPSPHFSFAPPAGNLGFLGGVADLGDLNGDGLAEVLLGWPDMLVYRCPSDHPGFAAGSTGGAIRIHSGLDGSVLHEEVHGTPGTAMGGVVARLGDLDGDGLSDFAVATRMVTSHPYFCQLPGGNFLEVRSGANSALLWQVPASPRVVVGTEDANHDGVRDVALGYPYSGQVELRSGLDGSLLRTFGDPLDPGVNLFGHGLAAAVDPFGLRVPSLLVSAPQPLVFPIGVPGSPEAAGPGAVMLFSLDQRPRMLALLGDEVGEEFGSDVAHLGDVDGDGRIEVAVGIASAETDGLIRVLSLRRSPRALESR
jgi:hypothetical protein